MGIDCSCHLGWRGVRSFFPTGEGVIDGVDVRREPTPYEEDQGLCSGV